TRSFHCLDSIRSPAAFLPNVSTNVPIAITSYEVAHAASLRSPANSMCLFVRDTFRNTRNLADCATSDFHDHIVYCQDRSGPRRAYLLDALPDAIDYSRIYILVRQFLQTDKHRQRLFRFPTKPNLCTGVERKNGFIK